MSEPYLMQISFQNMEWLNARQSLIAANVANASTPGYKARDVRPFNETLETVAISPSATHASHIATDTSLSPAILNARETPWATYHSGGNVSLEQEMVKASEVSAAYRLNTSVVRTFHTLYLSMAQ